MDREDSEVGRRTGDELDAPDAHGSRERLDAFAPRLYQELRSIAHRQLTGEREDHTLSTTALVHEAYLKLAELDHIEWRNRAQFCAEAARAMRRILVDYAVRRGAQKRGGDRRRVEMRESYAMTDAQFDRLLALHEALEEFEREWPRQARVVECRFFAGMTIPEMSEALEISEATVSRDWQLARAWLNRALA
ncbi:MAG: ECF-type sigma factor [Gemmatimonadota bacterium]